MYEVDEGGRSGTATARDDERRFLVPGRCGVLGRDRGGRESGSLVGEYSVGCCSRASGLDVFGEPVSERREEAVSAVGGAARCEDGGFATAGAG